MAVHPDGRDSIWLELPEGYGVAADAKALQEAVVYADDARNRWTPRNDSEQRLIYSERCKAAAIRHLGGRLPAGVVVRSTPQASGRPWPRFEDVDLNVVIFARGPRLHHPDPEREREQDERDPGRPDMRWVQLVGWIAGGRIKAAGIVRNNGYLIPWPAVEKISTLLERLADDLRAGGS